MGKSSVWQTFPLISGGWDSWRLFLPVKINVKKTWTPCTFLCLLAKGSCPIQQQTHIFHSLFLLPSGLSPESIPGGLSLYKSHLWTIQQCLCAPSVSPLPALTSFMYLVYIWGRPGILVHPFRPSVTFHDFFHFRMGSSWDWRRWSWKTSMKHQQSWKNPVGSTMEKKGQWAQSNRQQLLWTQSNFQDHPLLHHRNQVGLSVSCSKNKGNWD